MSIFFKPKLRVSQTPTPASPALQHLHAIALKTTHCDIDLAARVGSNTYLAIFNQLEVAWS